MRLEAALAVVKSLQREHQDELVMFNKVSFWQQSHMHCCSCSSAMDLATHYYCLQDNGAVVKAVLLAYVQILGCGGYWYLASWTWRHVWVANMLLEMDPLPHTLLHSIIIGLKLMAYPFQAKEEEVEPVFAFMDTLAAQLCASEEELALLLEEMQQHAAAAQQLRSSIVVLSQDETSNTDSCDLQT